MPTVAIVGASPKPDRYSHMAVVAYRDKGWTVWPINPAGEAVAGIAAFRTLAELPGRPDIVCMYVNAKTGAAMLDEIVAAKPEALWLNPGADGDPISTKARERGLRVVESCTLVALRLGDPLQIARQQGGG